MPSRRDVVVTGLGVISPVGTDLQDLYQHLIASRSGIHLWSCPGLVKKFPAGIINQSFREHFTRLELPSLDRCGQIAVLAARQAIQDAGLGTFEASGPRAGLYYGTVRGGAEAENQWYRETFTEGKQTARPFTIMAIMHNSAASQISIRHQVLGPVMTHSSACTSSGTAIGEAYRAIRDGYLDVAIAGGAEAPLTSGVFGAWDGTRALAAPDAIDVSRSSKPFSRERSGLVLGEGSAFVILESVEHARARGALAYAQLSGYGISADAYHISSPKTEGQVIAMRAALADAGISAGELQYINAHATATRGDADEADAIRTMAADAWESIPVSSTKAIHGHLLGAASALEFVITTLAATESFLPATAHLDDIDPACSLHHVPNNAVVGYPINRAMSFSAGLGGTNVALIISRESCTRRLSQPPSSS